MVGVWRGVGGRRGEVGWAWRGAAGWRAGAGRARGSGVGGELRRGVSMVVGGGEGWGGVELWVRVVLELRAGGG